MTDPTIPSEAELLASIPAEVLEHDFGCGSAWRWARDSETVIDLGCGSGKSCFLLSQVVGRSGHVIGIDASAPLLAVAGRHQEEVALAVGWSNVRFVESRIEDLRGMGSAGPLVDEARTDLVAGASIDLVASACADLVSGGCADLVSLDCVLTFVQARERGSVLDEALRLLRPGGRLLVADVLREDLEGLPESLAGSGFGRLEVLERSREPDRVIDGVPRFATTVRAFRVG